mmetsp:Transcript_5843/g.14443  ORF Transcript_5843/g.14443 Transcript_5843/m.14443 type:complete len:214 (+) Transcript_5843:489-1130(+)
MPSSRSASSFWKSSAMASKPFRAVRSPTRSFVRAQAFLNASLSRLRQAPNRFAIGLILGSSSDSSSTTVDKYSAYSSSCGNASAAPSNNCRSLAMLSTPVPSASAASKSCFAKGSVRSCRTVAASPIAKIEPALPRTWSHSSVMMPLAGAFKLVTLSSEMVWFLSMRDSLSLVVNECSLMPAAHTVQPYFNETASPSLFLTMFTSSGVTSTTL